MSRLNAYERKLKHIYVGAGFFFSTILIGTIGYMQIEDARLVDSLYMTVITISTVGFREVFDLSDSGKLFTVFLVVTGTGTAAYTASQFIDYIVAGEIRKSIRRLRKMAEIAKLNDHYIICGYGRMGRVITSRLQDNGVDVVVIDENEDSTAALEDNKIFHVIGDATEEDVLNRANIANAKGLISVVDTDVKNVYIVLTARGFRKDLYIITKASSESAQQKLSWAGANKVFSPYAVGATSIANSLLKPNVSEFLDLALGVGDLAIEVEEMAVPEGSYLDGKRLMESGLRKNGLIIIAVKNGTGEFLYNPGPETVMNGGDTLIALGRRDDFVTMRETLKGGAHVAL